MTKSEKKKIESRLIQALKERISTLDNYVGCDVNSSVVLRLTQSIRTLNEVKLDDE